MYDNRIGNSRTSPQTNKRGCLCKNGKYSTKCCKGNILNQGIGKLKGQGVSSVSNESSSTTKTNQSTDYNL